MQNSQPDEDFSIFDEIKTYGEKKVKYRLKNRTKGRRDKFHVKSTIPLHKRERSLVHSQINKWRNNGINIDDEYMMPTNYSAGWNWSDCGAYKSRIYGNM